MNPQQWQAKSAHQPLDDNANSPNIALLLGLLRRSYLTYYPSLARLAGSPKAGLMLGHALYYSKQLSQSQPEREGWFYMGGLDWFKATGLSLHEQDTARQQLCAEANDKLSKPALLKVKRLGMPARLWYQVKLDTLCQVIQQAGLAKHGGIKPGTNSALTASDAASGWQLDEAAIKVLLGRVVVFYADIAHLAGSASAGIYLSQLLNEYQFRTNHQQLDAQGYAVAPDAHAWNALYLGDKAVRNARDQAQAVGWIEFKRASRKGGDLLYRVNTNALTTAISHFDLSKHCAKQACFALSGELGFALSANQVVRKGQNLKTSERQTDLCFAQTAELGSALFVEQGFALSGELGFALFADQVMRKGQNPYIDIKNSNNLLQRVVEKNTAAPKNHHPAPQEGLGGGYLDAPQKQNTVKSVDFKNLIIPSIILETEYPTLQTILSLSKQPQHILDELLGHSKKSAINSPCAYIRYLVNKEMRGELILTYAHRIHAKRQEAQTIAQAVAASNQAADSETFISEEAKAIQDEEIAQGYAVLAKMREQRSRKAVIDHTEINPDVVLV